MAEGQGRSSEQGVKLLYIRDYLHKYTNKEHPKSAKEICEYLASKGIKADRKTIYNDILRLQVDFQEPIEYNPKKWGYYITTPQFSLYELQILMDCVRSSNFQSSEDVSHTSQKIGELANVYDYAKLRNVEWFDKDPVRPLNSELYNVELIQQAIEENKKISFRRYLYYPIHANRSDNGKMYIKSHTGNDVHIVSPKELVRYEGHYVLVCYRTDSKMHHVIFPVQYLENIVVLPSERECIDLEKTTQEVKPVAKEKTPASELSREEKVDRIRSMIGYFRYSLVEALEKNIALKYTHKRKIAITLLFKNEDAELILNEFGYETVLVPTGGVFCSATIRIPLQPEFYNWLFMNRSKVRVISPNRVIEAYCEYVEAVLLQYELWNMDSDEVLSYMTQPTAKTTGKWFIFFEQIMEEVIKKRKSYFKLDKSIQKLMEVDDLE